MADPEHVLDYHRRRLRERAEQHHDNPHFCSGIAWGLYALERVDRALRGITDRDQLGIGNEPRRPPPIDDAPVDARPSITCPLCGRTSWHPEDVRHGYCGACHAVTTPHPRTLPAARKDPA